MMRNKNNFHLKGLTLTELIIVAVISAIMMLGVVGANLGFRQMEKTVSSDAQLYMKTLAMAEEVRNTARLAVGDFNNRGFRIVGDDTICFRISMNAAMTAYDDTKWKCYTKIANGMYRCEKSDEPEEGCEDKDQWIGSLVTDAYTCALCYPPRVRVTDSSYYLEFQFIARVSGGTAKIDGGHFVNNDETNPQVVISQRVPLLSHSF